MPDNENFQELLVKELNKRRWQKRKTTYPLSNSDGSPTIYKEAQDGFIDYIANHREEVKDIRYTPLGMSEFNTSFFMTKEVQYARMYAKLVHSAISTVCNTKIIENTEVFTPESHIEEDMTKTINITKKEFFQEELAPKEFFQKYVNSYRPNVDRNKYGSYGKLVNRAENNDNKARLALGLNSFSQLLGSVVLASNKRGNLSNNIAKKLKSFVAEKLENGLIVSEGELVTDSGNTHPVPEYGIVVIDQHGNMTDQFGNRIDRMERDIASTGDNSLTEPLDENFFGADSQTNSIEQEFGEIPIAQHVNLDQSASTGQIQRARAMQVSRPKFANGLPTIPENISVDWVGKVSAQENQRQK